MFSLPVHDRIEEKTQCPADTAQEQVVLCAFQRVVRHSSGQQISSRTEQGILVTGQFFHGQEHADPANDRGQYSCQPKTEFRIKNHQPQMHQPVIQRRLIGFCNTLIHACGRSAARNRSGSHLGIIVFD